MFDHVEIGIPCPKCGQKTKQTVAWVKANNQFTCRCGAIVNFDSKGLVEGLDSARDTLKKFKRDIGQLFKS